MLPERSAFLRDERPPSASVTISSFRGLPSTSLRSEACGDRSGAVEGLKASDVVLVDHEGTLLAGGEDEEGGISGMLRC